MSDKKWIIKVSDHKKGKSIEIDMDIVLLIYVTIAIATHEELHNEINTLYEEHKWNAALAYQTSPYFNHPSFRSFVATDEKRIIKTAFLFALYEKEGTGKDFAMKFLRNGYKRIYDYIERNPKLNTLNFIDYIQNRHFEYL